MRDDLTEPRRAHAPLTAGRLLTLVRLRGPLLDLEGLGVIEELRATNSMPEAKPSTS
jgi:hypothetical protein